MKVERALTLLSTTPRSREADTAATLLLDAFSRRHSNSELAALRLRSDLDSFKAALKEAIAAARSHYAATGRRAGSTDYPFGLWFLQSLFLKAITYAPPRGLTFRDLHGTPSGPAAKALDLLDRFLPPGMLPPPETPSRLSLMNEARRWARDCVKKSPQKIAPSSH